MSGSRENFLVQSLKHVSVQRLRELKMDMDKIAKDSVISNERSFWSVLEHHNIRLDERTKKDFYKQVSDNKGVDIKVAIKCLTKAQKKTGRDSVEVLPKPKADNTTRSNEKSPKATSLQAIVPTTPRRHDKLDKHRTSTLRTGKLEAGPKTAPSKAQDQSSVNSKSSGVSVAEKYEESTATGTTGKITSKNQAMENKAELDEDSKIDEPISKDSSSEPKSSFLKLLLENNAPRSKMPSSPPTTDDKNVSDGTKVQEEKSEKRLEENQLESEERSNSPAKDSSKDKEEEVEKEAAEDQHQSETGRASISMEEGKDAIRVNNHQITDSSSSPAANESNSKPKDSIDSEAKSESSPEIARKEENRNELEKSSPDQTNPNVNDTEQSEPSSEKQLEPTQPESKSTLGLHSRSQSSAGVATESTNDDVGKLTLKEEKRNNIEEETPNDKNEMQEPNAKECIPKSADSESVVQTSMEVSEDRNDKVESQSANKTNSTHRVADESDVVGSQSFQPENRKSETDFPHQTNSPIENDNPTKSLVEEQEEKAEKETASSSLNNNELGDRSGSMSTAQNDAAAEMEEESKNTDDAVDVHPYNTKDLLLKNNDKDVSDTWSLSTSSSMLEEEATSNESSKDDGKIKTANYEDVVVGEGVVKLLPPPGIYKNEEQPTDFLPSLQMDWVYGCDTCHQQCLGSTRSGELMYFVGSTVILYNHERNAQRWYTEHTAQITSVATLPAEDLVASAQERRSNHSASHRSNKADPSDGSVHVRVWNSVGLETLYIIGVGALQHPVFKMAFLNIQRYLLTIEHDKCHTMTLWDGGCRVTSAAANPQDPVEEEKKEELTSAKKRFSSSRSRSTNNDLSSSGDAKAFIQESAGLYTSECVVGNLKEKLWFATSGKEHLSFWKLMEHSIDQPASDGYQFSTPIHGSFGESFFRAEYISSCLATSKFMDGCVVTGDSNGTLLFWSERSKVASRGFPHAHQCAISCICMNEEGYIFTAGAKDRLIKAFCMRKSKVESCGKMKIPGGLGSAVCIVYIEETLFVATEKSAILSLNVQVKLSPQNKANSSPQTTGHPPLVSRHTVPIILQQKQNENDEKTTEAGIFTCWDDHEVARSLEKGIRSVCTFPLLKLKQRPSKGYKQKNNQLSQPTTQEGIAIIQRQMSKNAHKKKKVFRSTKAIPQKDTVPAWKRSYSSESKPVSSRLSISASSPKLRTNERILEREKALQETRRKTFPRFTWDNYVEKTELFAEKRSLGLSKGNCFVTVSTDGCLLVYNSYDHRVYGRCKLQLRGDVISMDVCARRHLVVVGTSAGQVAVVRINKDQFEVLPSLKCQFSDSGPSKINALKFSPSGINLAVAIERDVIIYRAHRFWMEEHGRCIGHQSQVISDIGWTKKKHGGTYFLKSCSISPIPELKIWHVNKLKEDNSQEWLYRADWQTSIHLDFYSKGIWSKFSNPRDVTSAEVCSTTKADGHSNAKRNDAKKFLLIGDVDGNVNVEKYPCLIWNEEQNQAHSVHCSEVRNIVSSAQEQYVLSSTGKDMIQWRIREASPQ